MAAIAEKQGWNKRETCLLIATLGISVLAFLALFHSQEINTINYSIHCNLSGCSLEKHTFLYDYFSQKDSLYIGIGGIGKTKAIYYRGHMVANFSGNKVMP